MSCKDGVCEIENMEELERRWIEKKKRPKSIEELIEERRHD